MHETEIGTKLWSSKMEREHFWIGFGLAKSLFYTDRDWKADARSWLAWTNAGPNMRDAVMNDMETPMKDLFDENEAAQQAIVDHLSHDRFDERLDDAKHFALSMLQNSHTLERCYIRTILKHAGETLIFSAIDSPPANGRIVAILNNLMTNAKQILKEESAVRRVCILLDGYRTALTKLCTIDDCRDYIDGVDRAFAIVARADALRCLHCLDADADDTSCTNATTTKRKDEEDHTTAQDPIGPNSCLQPFQKTLIENIVRYSYECRPPMEHADATLYGDPPIHTSPEKILDGVRWITDASSDVEQFRQGCRLLRHAFMWLTWWLNLMGIERISKRSIYASTIKALAADLIIIVDVTFKELKKSIPSDLQKELRGLQKVMS